MANFLRDYIEHRGMDTIIRTIYGILDKDTGEHLVPVQHANRYFSELEIITIYNLPNQGFVDYDGSGIPGGDKKPKAPFWKFLTVNGNPITAGSTLAIDGTIPTVITGSCEVENASDDTTVAVSEYEINMTPAGTNPTVNSDGTWSWTGDLVTLNAEVTVHIEGDATNEHGKSPTSAAEQKFIPYDALQITRDLTGITIYKDEGQSETISIDIFANSAPNPRVCDLLFNGSVKMTSNTPSFTLPSMTSADSGAYQIRVKDALNRTILSNIDAYSVNALMAFTTDLTIDPVSMQAGQTLSLEVVVSGGAAPLTYQWYNGALEVGTNSNKYTKANAQAADNGTYKCVVTDAAGKVIESKMKPIDVYQEFSWKIDIPTEERTPTVGEEMTLTVELQGGKQPYSYRWMRDYGGHEGAYPSGTPSVTFTVDETPVTWYCEGSCTINGSTVKINSGRVTINPVTA